jgi:hypothetical protein
MAVTINGDLDGDAGPETVTLVATGLADDPPDILRRHGLCGVYGQHRADRRAILSAARRGRHQVLGLGFLEDRRADGICDRGVDRERVVSGFSGAFLAHLRRESGFLEPFPRERRRSTEPKVRGSNPLGRATYLATICL